MTARKFWIGFREGWREPANLPDWAKAAAFTAGAVAFLLFGTHLVD